MFLYTHAGRNRPFERAAAYSAEYNNTIYYNNDNAPPPPYSRVVPGTVGGSSKIKRDPKGNLNGKKKIIYRFGDCIQGGRALVCTCTLYIFTKVSCDDDVITRELSRHYTHTYVVPTQIIKRVYLPTFVSDHYARGGAVSPDDL